MDRVLIVPKNDPESLMISRLAAAINLPTVISDQPHGAKLEREPNLIARIKKANQEASTVVIVEIPGTKAEAELTNAGFELVIIDHHRYDDLDRMKAESSIEQFRALFDLNDQMVRKLGFDPVIVNAVGLIDRGFLWELTKEGWSEEDREKGIAGYQALRAEIAPERHEREEAEAIRAWENRREQDGVIIVENGDDLLSLREALSFIVAREYPKAPPTMLVLQGTRRIYVQDTDKARALFDRFGGFTFGRDRCWGVLVQGDKKLPSIDEVLQVVVK